MKIKKWLIYYSETSILSFETRKEAEKELYMLSHESAYSKDKYHLYKLVK